jgi:hypothetical protein
LRRHASRILRASTHEQAEALLGDIVAGQAA